VSDRASRDRIAVYAAGAGDWSVKTVLEAHSYVSCDSVAVTSAEFDVMSMNGIEYLAATFHCDVAGTGAS